MAGDWSIEEPQSLFTLPIPVDPASGCTRGGRVYGFQRSKKRKRTEIVIGVDGECLNVYSVKTPRLLTSHALPPHTYLTSSPACAYRAASEQQPAQRFTYATTRNDLGGTGRKELLCFQEDVAAATTAGIQTAKTPLKWTKDVANAHFAIVHLEPIPGDPVADGTESHDVLVVFDNGDVTVLSENLQVEKFSATTTARMAANTTESECHSISRVDLVSVQTFSEARNGLLKFRPDLIATIPAASTIVLLVMGSSVPGTPNKEQHMIHIFAIPPSHLKSQARHTTHPIISCNLPLSQTPIDANKGKAQFAYDQNSASLFRLDQSTVSVYKLSFTTPKIISRFHAPQDEDTRLLPVSRSTSLVTSGNQCALYDARYGSLHIAKTVCNSTVFNSSTRKRKRSNAQNGDNPIVLWFVYSKLGVVIGLMGHDIVSLEVSTRSKDQNQHDQSQLINSLGLTRGTPVASDHLLGLEPQHEGDLRPYSVTKLSPAWLEIISTLRDLSPSEKASSFDRFFFDNLRSFTDKSGDLDMSYKYDLALKAISVIFDRAGENPTNKGLGSLGPPCVKLSFTPRMTLEWIIKSGNLTAQNLSKALFVFPSAADEAIRPVLETDLVGAIAEADTQLSLLALLVASNRLGLSGSLESFKVLLGSFDSTENSSINDLLDGSKPDQTAKAFEEDLQHAAALELQVATSVLNEDFDARGSALKKCLGRLGTCYSLSELVQAFRRQLTRREMLMLIELLRIELEQAGWTSRRLDFHPSYDATESQNEAVAVICKLLNCALDAMGATGWLAEQDSTDADNASALISHLRAETSAVLEGVQEATFFAGFLKDLVRFEDVQAESSKRGRRTGAWVRSRMLPLGFKDAQRESTTRVGAGGELQKLSARRVGLEASQKKGRYEFEKIRI